MVICQICKYREAIGSFRITICDPDLNIIKEIEYVVCFNCLTSQKFANITAEEILKGSY
jgi:hypothetical protein